MQLSLRQMVALLRPSAFFVVFSSIFFWQSSERLHASQFNVALLIFQFPAQLLKKTCPKKAKGESEKVWKFSLVTSSSSPPDSEPLALTHQVAHKSRRLPCQNKRFCTSSLARRGAAEKLTWNMTYVTLKNQIHVKHHHFQLLQTLPEMFLFLNIHFNKVFIVQKPFCLPRSQYKHVSE